MSRLTALEQQQAQVSAATAERLAVAAGGSTLVTSIIDDLGRNICVAFHPRANIIAFGGSDHVVKIWRFKTKQDETNQIVASTSHLEDDPEYYGHTIDITAIVFDPKHPIMITGSKYTQGSAHKALKLWLLSDDGTKIHRCVGLDRQSDVTDKGVLCIAVHPILPVFIVGYTNKTVAFYYYDYKGPMDITVYPPKIYTKISSDASSLAFHPSEPVLLVGTNSGEMKMFKFDPNPSTRQDMTVKYMFHTSIHSGTAIKSLAFHNVFPYILSQDYDGIMCLWSYSLDEVPQVNEFKFGPKIRSSPKSMSYAAAFHPSEALIMSATRTYVELYGFNPENGLPIKISDKTLMPLPIIMSPLHPHQLRRDVEARALTFTVGFHPSLDYCFTSYDNAIYIYNTSEVSKKAYNLRTMADKGPNAAILYSEMSGKMGAHSGIPRSSSAPPRAGHVVGNGNKRPLEHLTNPGSTVGPIIALFPPTHNLTKKRLTVVDRTTVVDGTTGVKRTQSAGKGRSKTSRSVKKIVRKTKKYRKHRITYRRRK
jgi:WD40 repeat protein